MTTYRVEISDPFLLAHRLEALADDWPDIAEKAMKDALTGSKYLQEAWRRTPKSNMHRYASMYAGVDLNIDKEGDVNDPSTWETRLPSNWRQKAVEWHVNNKTKSGRERFTGPSMRGMDRIERYGRERLARSILPRQDGSDFHVVKGTKYVMLVLSSSVEYAAKVHEAEKPAEGNYWTPGKTSGWSAYGTGSKYLERPYVQLQDKIVKLFGKNIDRELQRRGLL